MNESQLVAKIKKYLKEKGAYVEKIWGGGFQSAGIPDIIACYKGRFLGIEVKVGNNKPSEIQLVKLERINNAGGVGIAVWSLKEVVDLIDYLDNGKEKEMRDWSK